VDLRLVFLGTPRFAVPSLEALAAEGHQIAAVWTQPDRPRGRGRATAASPVKECALRLGLTVHQPERIRRPEEIEAMRALAPRAMVVVGYGQILPRAILDIPPLGIVNVHASLLPKYRGAAPIQWAIARGETVTGVTTMRIDEGLDTGDILLAEETAIGPDETAPELSERLAAMGARLLGPTLRGLDTGTLVPRPQDHSLATRAPMLTKEDGRIDWTLTAQEIRDRLRGFDPWPGAYTTFRGRTLQVTRAAVAPRTARGEPGALTVERRRLVAAAGGGTALELIEVQLEGRKRISAEAFINGHRPSENERLGV
jgi:methionyl-tRNA formyltransferase